MPAFLLDAHQFCDQTAAATVASGLQASLQITFHRPNACNHAQETNHTGEPGEAVRSGDETGPVGAWQTEQLADDRERQLPRITLDEVGRASVSEKLGCKLICNCENSRFHVENGAPTKGLVDDTAQPCVVRLVHGQHADRERSYPPWHPPAQTGNCAVPPHRERLAVF